MSASDPTPKDRAPHAKDVFGEALELEPDRRAAFLAERCAGDAELRREVDGLLSAHARSSHVFGPGTDTPWSPLVHDLLRAASGELTSGSMLGPYRILEQAGSGGFGTVYLAQQTTPVTRRVALKVMRHGLDSEPARARFDAERQALARMEHPGIARVFDAGTLADGRPYFAMEFVPGLPITEYCERHELDLTERLRIFRAVCQAVQHAHQKGVVHRDLKPTNVLVADVDGAPAPKVIDFGVAKAIDRPLTELALVSVDGQIVGTPAYMSPEQASGEIGVDTRSDVYGLGALLYELLAGRPPFDVEGVGLATLLDAIARVDPPRPSARAARSGVRDVPADLDWVTMRCLEKERDRRYPSAGALAAEIERFLDGRPVEAAPPSVWYRLGKLTRRHRLAVGAAVALVLVFAAGTIGTVVGLVRANRANDRAEVVLTQLRDEVLRANRAEAEAAIEARNARVQAEVARAVNDFVTQDLLASAIPSAEEDKGHDVSLRVVLDAASRGIGGVDGARGRFDGQPEVEASIRFMLGTVYAKLGELDSAIEHMRRVVELDEREFGANDRRTLHARSTLADHLRRAGALAEAESMLPAAVEAQRRALGDANSAVLLARWHLGNLRLAQDRAEEARQEFAEALEHSVEALGPRHALTLSIQSALAVALQELGQVAAAERAFRAVLDGRREALGADHPDTIHAEINLSALLGRLGRNDESRDLLVLLCPRAEAVLGAEHPSTLRALYNLGVIDVERGRGADAESSLRKAIEGLERTRGADHEDVLRARGSLARSVELQGRAAEAEVLHRAAFEHALRVLGTDHVVTDARRTDLASFLIRDPGRRGEVLELLHASLDSQRRRVGPDHPSTLRAMANLALIHQQQGELDRAEPLLREALAGLQKRLTPDHVVTLRVESDLAGLLVDLEQWDEAERFARHAVDVGQRDLPADSYDLARFRLRLGLALRGSGRGAEGLALFEAAHATLLATRGAGDPFTAYAAEQIAEWAESDRR